MKVNLIVGITGMSGSGKGAVVEILKQKGCKHFSASGYLLEEVIKINMPQNRDSLIFMGNKLREQFGPGYVAEELIKRAKMGGGAVIIESIRTLGEVEVLKKAGGILLAVDADQKVRFERIIKRGGIKDNVSWEQFVDQENQELESSDLTKQNLVACRNVADFVIDNNGSLTELEKQVNDFIKKYE